MRLIQIFLLIILLSISAFSQKSLRPGEEAPTFSASSLDGNFYDLAALKGSVVVMTFWSTTCAICKSEIPMLNKFTSQYSGKKVVFLALTMENEQRVESYLRSTQFNFQILPDSFGVLLQYADRTKGGNLDMGFPAFYVVDKGGKIAYRSSGYDKTASLAIAIDRLISE